MEEKPWTVLKSTWKGMKSRCYDKSDMTYRYYGAKGVTMCDRWRMHGKGLKNFYEDMGPKPAPEYTVDRIDPFGNYEPSNCRWATPLEQLLNKRFKSPNRGVSFYETKYAGTRWRAVMTWRGKRVLCENFDTKQEAIAARKAAEDKYWKV